MKARAMVLGCILLLALVLSPAKFTAQARPTGQAAAEPPHPRRFYGPPEFSNSPAPVSGLAEFEAQAGNLSWTTMVFEIFTDLGWDIAYQDGINQEFLLTHNAAVDLTPSLSPDGFQVAYGTKDAGNYRLTILDMVSAEHRYLTGVSGDAVAPSWSPDGSRIAFEWDLNGNSDIWVINTDGSGLTRLTSDPDYDGMPDWSPDGTMLAFVSHRSGGYRVYSMNVDGSNPVQLSFQPYSGDPAWSPDGTMIAYDADGDQDGWFELWMMEADGKNQVMVARSTSTFDYLMGSWSPDGKKLAYSSLEWSLYDSEWYLIAISLQAVEYTSGWTVLLSSQEAAMSPDWISMDRIVPTSQVLPLPRFARPGVKVSWTGQDLGGSEISYYDIQTRDLAGGSWLDWLAGTNQTSASLKKTGGHTYQLRSRAQDAALHLESWPEAADAVVTLYNWMIAGQVRNNRGAPVINPSVQASGGPFYSAPTGLTGSYQVYVADAASSYTSDWQKSGYGDLPVTSFPGKLDAAKDPVLPPAGDLIANGNFESAGLNPDWSAGGDFPPGQDSLTDFTGSKGAWLGEKNLLPFNDTFETWPYDDDEILGYYLEVDDEGRVHLAWSDLNTLFFGIKKEGVWEYGPSSIPGTTNSNGRTASLQVSASGVDHLAWSDGNNVYYRRYDHGVWGAVEQVSNSIEPASKPRLHLGPDGTVQMVYAGSNFWIYSRRMPNGAWSAEPTICNGDNELSIVQDTFDRVHIACYNLSAYIWREPDGQWQRDDIPLGHPRMVVKITEDGIVHASGSTNNQFLVYAYHLPGTGWSDQEFIHLEDAATLNMEIDPNGLARLIAGFSLGDEYKVFFRRISKDSWSAPVSITGLNFNDDIFYQIGSDGVDHVIREEPFSYFQRQPDADWTLVQEILGREYYRMIGFIDANNQPYTFGQESSVYVYAGPPLAGLNGSSLLTQTVTIPADLPAPTLSYLLDYSGAPSAPASGFLLTLDEGTSRTELNHLSASTTGWTHQWHDLSAWAGQTVTLTFQVDSAAGYYQTHASLDDVSLGAAHPSLWVRGSGSRFARPGEQLRYSIQFGAYSGPLAPNAVLTADLPSGWTFLSADPAPQVSGSQLTWEPGDLAGGSSPQAIQLNLECQSSVPLFSDLSIPVEIHSDLSEIDLEDNHASLQVLAAYPAFLPYVLR
jgi:hypothetical protein